MSAVGEALATLIGAIFGTLGTIRAVQGDFFSAGACVAGLSFFIGVNLGTENGWRRRGPSPKAGRDEARWSSEHHP